MSSWPNSWRKQHACTRCRRQKVRCEFDSWQATICRRCLSASAECIPYIPRNSSSETLGKHDTETTETGGHDKRSSSEDCNDHTKRRAVTSQSSAYRPAQTIFRVEKKPVMQEWTPQQDFGNPTPSSVQTTTASTGTSPFSAEKQPLSPSEGTLGPQSVHLFYSLSQHSKHSHNTANKTEDFTDIFSDSRKMGPGVAPTTDSELQVLIRAGHISREYCLELYAQFKEKMSGYVFFLHMEDEDLSFDDALEKWPRLVHARVTVAAINDPKTYSVLRYSLRKQLISMIFLDGVMSSEVIASLLLLYTWKLLPNKWNEFRHLIDLPLAVIVATCSQPPWTIIKHDKGRISMEDRISFRLQLVLYIYNSFMSLSIPRLGLLHWNDDLELKAKALEMTDPNPEEKLLLALCRILTVGREFLGSISRAGFKKNQYRNTLEFTAEIERAWNEFREKVITIEEQEKESSLHDHYMLIHSRLQLELYVCDAMLQKCGGFLSDDFAKSLMILVVERGTQMIGSFENLCKASGIFPTFFFFRPINCLIALIRLKRSKDFAKFDIPLDVPFLTGKVKRAWQKINPVSYAARASFPLIECFEEWLDEPCLPPSSKSSPLGSGDVAFATASHLPQFKRKRMDNFQSESTGTRHNNSSYEGYTGTTNFSAVQTPDDPSPLIDDMKQYSGIPPPPPQPQVDTIWNGQQPCNDNDNTNNHHDNNDNNSNNSNFQPRSAKGSATASCPWQDGYYPGNDETSTDSLLQQFLEGAEFSYLFDPPGQTSEEWSSLMRMG